MGIGPEKKPFIKRVQPVVGVLIIVMGLAPLLMALARGADWKKIQPLLVGLFMVGGGASVIAKSGASKGTVWGCLLGAFAVSGLLAYLARAL